MKTADCPFHLDEDAFQKLVDAYIVDNMHRIRTLESRRKHPRLLIALRRWLIDCDSPALDVDTVTAWMTERTRTAEPRTVQANAIMIANFCRYLVETDRMGANPFQKLRDRHRFDGYLGIARMLKESGGAGVLNEKVDIAFSGPLAPSFSEYLEYICRFRKIWPVNSRYSVLYYHGLTDGVNAEMFGTDGWSVELDRTSIFQDTVNDGLGEILVVEDGSPVREVLVGCYDYWAFALMSFVDDVEEHVSCVCTVGEIPEFVDDQDMRVQIGGQSVSK